MPKEHSTSRLYRLKEILGDLKATPPIPPMIPISKASWYKGQKAGRYPQPVRLGPRISAYRAEDIEKLMSGN